MQFANGITNKADLSQIKLFRLSGASVAQISIEDITELAEMTSNDNDKIIIREFPFREVEINGAVENPGKYIVNQGDGILKIVEQAGGYTETAYPFGGVLENLNTEKINEMAISELYTAFLNSISSMSFMVLLVRECLFKNLSSTLQITSTIALPIPRILIKPFLF